MSSSPAGRPTRPRRKRCTARVSVQRPELLSSRAGRRTAGGDPIVKNWLAWRYLFGRLNSVRGTMVSTSGPRSASPFFAPSWWRIADPGFVVVLSNGPLPDRQGALRLSAVRRSSFQTVGLKACETCDPPTSTAVYRFQSWRNRSNIATKQSHGVRAMFDPRKVLILGLALWAVVSTSGHVGNTLDRERR